MPNLTDLSNAVLATLDPFSPEFLNQVDSIKENIPELENPVNKKVRKARAPLTPKFYLSKPLKKRLISLANRTTNPDVAQICLDLLNKKRMETSSINYLGLSRDDFSKISYMDSDRVNRYKDETFTKTYFGPGAVVYIAHNGFSWDRDEHGNILRREKEIINSLKLTKSHIHTPILCENIGGNYVFKESPNINIYSRKLDVSITSSNEASEGFKLEPTTWRNLTSFKIDLIEKVESMVWNPDRRYHSSVGKVVRKVFGNKFNDNAICRFAEEYFDLIVVSDANYDLIFATGEDIRKYYYDVNYLPINHSQLWNSCMRHSRCQEYFGIYETNPNCQLAVLLYKDKVAARCLVWKNEEGTYFDRIYPYNNKAQSIIKSQLLSRGIKDLRENSYGYIDGHAIKIKAENVEDLMAEGAKFPYLDTLRYYNEESQTLSAEECGSRYCFSDTAGHFTDYESSNSSCACCGHSTDEEDLNYIEAGRYSEEYLCDHCCVYSETYQGYLYSGETVLDYYDDYVLRRNVIELVDGSYMDADFNGVFAYENDYGYFLPEEDFEYYQDEEGRYFHPDDPENPQNKEELNKINENILNEESNDNTIEQTNSNFLL